MGRSRCLAWLWGSRKSPSDPRSRPTLPGQTWLLSTHGLLCECAHTALPSLFSGCQALTPNAQTFQQPNGGQLGAFVFEYVLNHFLVFTRWVLGVLSTSHFYLSIMNASKNSFLGCKERKLVGKPQQPYYLPPKSSTTVILPLPSGQTRPFPLQGL